MPRQVAILIFTLFVVWLWRQDAKTRPQFSKALWIPLIWLLILGSHPISWWLSFFFGIGSTGGSNIEGNPINRVFYSCLILAAIVVVARRGVSWSGIIRNNLGLSIFLGYLALTILWSAYPFATTKRWIKEVGVIPVLLVILTEEKPLEAIKIVFTRAAFVLFSYSVLVIKYFPEIGRNYGSHSGEVQITGIAAQKNSLGEIVAACSLIILWQLLEGSANGRRAVSKAPGLQWVITLVMGAWLLYHCDSKTSILSLVLGSAIVVSTRVLVLARKPKTVVGFCLLVIPLFFTLDSLFGISGALLRMIGRDPTLTHRTEIWQAVLQRPVDPVFGCGFLNYWDMYTIDLHGNEVWLATAHNGYLEIYLDGGALGLVCLLIMLFHAGVNHSRAFLQSAPASAIGFALLSMTLVANFSESLYARRTPLWVCFLLFCLYSSGRSHAALPVPETGHATQETNRDDPALSPAVY